MICPKCQNSEYYQYSGIYNCNGCRYSEVRKDFRIIDENLTTFKTAMARLAKRAKRVGVTAPTFTLGEPEDIEEKNNSGKPTGRVRRYWPCTVSGETPKYAGWTFLATIQHMTLDDGTKTNLVRKVPGVEIAVSEAYRTVGPDCNHCNQFRNRKDTYLLLSEKGEIKQVGSTCLQDFLGHGSPAALAAMAEILCEAMEIGEEGESYGGGYRQRFTVLHYLSWVSSAMQEYGWISRKMANETGGTSTADFAYGWMLRPDGKHVRTPTHADDKRAELALEWASTLHEHQDITNNDYLYNVNVVARCMMLGDRSTGIAASIISAYERAMATERENKVARATSQFVGNVGQRLELTLTILTVKEIPGDVYGPSYLHLMVDAEGNRFKWFAKSSKSIGDAGETVTIKGTVKKHDSYQGVAQTTLSRCALFVPKKKKVK